MFTPLGLDTEHSRAPFATCALIGLMVLGTVAYQTLDPALVDRLALDADAFRPWQIVTSMLLHAGVLHLLFNALFLWVFGRFVEDRLGPWRFLLLFLLFEAAGDAAWLLGGTGHAVGASGAIAGCMGLVLFTVPGANVTVYWEFVPFARIRRFPVWFLLGFWILTDLWLAFRTSAGWGTSSTAWQAHLGGWFAGCVSSWILRSPLARGTGWHLPRAPYGGERLEGAYGEMVQSEVMWRTLDENLRARREQGDGRKPKDVVYPRGRPPRQGTPGVGD